MRVVHIAEFVNRDSVVVLEELLALAKKGAIRGIVCCAKDFKGREIMSFTGDYQRNPDAALGAAMRVSTRLNQLMDARDDKFF